MINNIKYIRFASTVFKFIMVINALIGLGTFAFSMLGTTLSAVQGNATGTTVSAVINIGAFVSIVINAFIMYTVARGLELFADVAERVEVIRRTQWEQINGQVRPPNIS